MTTGADGYRGSRVRARPRGRHARRSRHRVKAFFGIVAIAVVSTALLVQPDRGGIATLAADLDERSDAGNAGTPTVAVPAVVRPSRTLTTPKRPAPPRSVRKSRPVVPNVVRSTGRLSVVPGTARASGPGRTLTYRLEIEQGLTFRGPAIANAIHRTLIDPRGWQRIKGVRFERTDKADADLRIVLATPALTDRLCRPLVTGGELSCRVDDRVILNAKRWAYGAPAYVGKVEAYRDYLVNHEVGHALGYGHSQCTRPGTPAPVMMQQTKGLQGCRSNPWPSVNPT